MAVAGDHQQLWQKTLNGYSTAQVQFTTGSKNKGSVSARDTLTSDRFTLIVLMDFICFEQKWCFAIGKTLGHISDQRDLQGSFFI